MINKYKLSELSSFSNEYTITNSFNEATEIHGLLHSLSIDGYKIHDVIITRSHIYFSLSDDRQININFKKLPKFFDL
jgi:GH35 family endo-1,4-beta-xylanase